MVFCLGVMESCLEIVVAEASSFCIVEAGASIAGVVVGLGVVEGMCEVVPSGVVALEVVVALRVVVAVALRARARWRARRERSMATSMS